MAALSYTPRYPNSPAVLNRDTRQILFWVREQRGEKFLPAAVKLPAAIVAAAIGGEVITLEQSEAFIRFCREHVEL